MTLSTIFANAVKQAKLHSPEILTALGISGVVSTTYLAGKASFQAADVIRMYNRVDHQGKTEKEQRKEKFGLVWRLYIPAGLSGASTITCILAANKANGSRTAAAVTAYSVTERAFSDYKEKVVEQIGKNQEQKIRDELVQTTIKAEAPKQEIVIAGTGHILCCELYTGRYFRSDMEALRKAQNDINAKIVNEIYVALDEFYDLLGLNYTSQSNRLGWDSDKLLELKFSTVMADNNEPCLAFEYNYVKPL